jgi:uncharacterized protein (TIGR04552 family)
MSTSPKARYEPYKTIDRFSVWDLELVRFILRGGSVFDWNRLNLLPAEVKAFCRAHRLDFDNPDDFALVERIKNEAVIYLREILSFPIPNPVRNASLVELLEMAGDITNRHRQFCACTLLKTMHIINHFDANEARQALEMTDQELFKSAERRIYKTISHMMANQLPVVEFLGGRKQRVSMVTKLLSKSAPLTAQLFDKMRFRIITSSLDDVLAVINYLSRNLFPFNYVLGGESYNTLLEFANYCSNSEHLNKLTPKLQLDANLEASLENRLQMLSNSHSSPLYRVVHWVADMPLRVPDFERAYRTDGVNPVPRPIIYVRTELQIVDRKSHRQNEKSDASHDSYKERQTKAVANRLKVGLQLPQNT